MKYLFYYDECEHNRKITQNTIKASNFENNFCTAIIGFNVDVKENFEEDYIKFEEKYKKIYTLDKECELKSSIIKKEKYKNGLHSFKKDDKSFLNDFLDLMEKYNVLLYCGFINKIEYLIGQMFKYYTNNYLINDRTLIYSLTKFICMYRPIKVIDAIYSQNEIFIYELKKFALERLKANKNIALKKFENKMLNELLILLDSCSYDISIDWNYTLSFEGFNKYLIECNISDYFLTIDREGVSTTLIAAQNMKLNCDEATSNSTFGIRVADIIVGIISRFICALEDVFIYKSEDETQKKRFINKSWFYLNQDTYDILKKLKNFLLSNNNVWYKYYSGIYGDSLLVFICYLNYIQIYSNLDNFKKYRVETHQEYFNTYCIESLNERYKLLGSPIEIEYK